eukprot:9485824-Pyramimonas_sp.AAC.1
MKTRRPYVSAAFVLRTRLLGLPSMEGTRSASLVRFSVGYNAALVRYQSNSSFLKHCIATKMCSLPLLGWPPHTPANKSFHTKTVT